MNGSNDTKRRTMNDIRYTGSAKKCMACNKSPSLIKAETSVDGPPSYEMWCKTCHMSSGLWLTPDEAKMSWDRFNSLTQKEELTITNPNQDLPPCSECGRHPEVHEHSSSFDHGYWDIGCSHCKRWSGDCHLFNDAKMRWEKMNPKEEEVLVTVDDVNRCTVCGESPYLKRHNIRVLREPTKYEIGCKHCKRSSTICETLDSAKACWDFLNPPKIMEGKRVNPCITCGTEVQVRFDKEHRSYEVNCTKCGRGVFAQDLPQTIFKWNEWNPKEVVKPEAIRSHELERLRVSEITSINACIKKLEEAANESRGALNARWNGTDYGNSQMPFTLVEQIKNYEYGISRLKYLFMPKFEIKEEKDPT